MSAGSVLLDELPVLQRLAMSYVPASAREPTLALLALDTRLAAILRAAREPMLAQLRLAWWREQLRMDPATWPTGEPLLAALHGWAAHREALAALADGWEAMTAPAPLPAAALQTLASARGAAFGALADLLGVPAERDRAVRLGGNWALADLATRLSHPDERGAARELARAADWRPARLSRRLRPLVVLHGLAARAIRQDRADGGSSPTDLAVAMRLGLLGR